MTRITKELRRLVRLAEYQHGTSPEMVITIYPGGIIGLRERGRRQKSELTVKAAGLYVQLLRNKVANEKAAKRKGRK